MQLRPRSDSRLGSAASQQLLVGRPLRSYSPSLGMFGRGKRMLKRPSLQRRTLRSKVPKLGAPASRVILQSSWMDVRTWMQQLARQMQCDRGALLRRGVSKPHASALM
jgi:hypothetical protein